MRLPGLTSRIESATVRAREAAAEAALSRRRHEAMRRDVIEPLEQAGSGDVIAKAVTAVLHDAAAGNGTAHWDKAPCLDGVLPSLLRTGGESLWRLCLTCPVSESCVIWACTRLETAARNGNGRRGQEGG